MYCKFVDVSGHAYRYYFDRLVFDGVHITLYDVDGYPVTVFPAVDVSSLTIE